MFPGHHHTSLHIKLISCLMLFTHHTATTISCQSTIKTYLYSIPSVNSTTTRHRATHSIETILIHSLLNMAISLVQPVTSIPSTLVTPIPSTPHSSVFHKARKLASPDFTMAPLPLNTPNDPSPDRTTPITSNNLPDNDISVILRPAMETLSLA